MTNQNDTIETLTPVSVTDTQNGAFIHTACGKLLHASPHIACLPFGKRVTALEEWLASFGGGVSLELGRLEVAPDGADQLRRPAA